MARNPYELLDILTDEDVAPFYNIFNKRYISSHKNSLMCRLSLETSMRVSEIINLKKKNIYWNTSYQGMKRKTSSNCFYG